MQVEGDGLRHFHGRIGHGIDDDVHVGHRSWNDNRSSSDGTVVRAALERVVGWHRRALGLIRRTRDAVRKGELHRPHSPRHMDRSRGVFLFIGHFVAGVHLDVEGKDAGECLSVCRRAARGVGRTGAHFRIRARLVLGPVRNAVCVSVGVQHFQFVEFGVSGGLGDADRIVGVIFGADFLRAFDQIPRRCTRGVRADHPILLPLLGHEGEDQCVSGECQIPDVMAIRWIEGVRARNGLNQVAAAIQVFVLVRIDPKGIEDLLPDIAKPVAVVVSARAEDRGNEKGRDSQGRANRT